MKARDIRAGDVLLHDDPEQSPVYEVLSVRAMRIDGKPAMRVEVEYRDGHGSRYWYEDDEVPLTRWDQNSDQLLA